MGSCSSLSELLVVLGVSASLVVGGTACVLQAKDFIVHQVQAYAQLLQKVAAE